MTDVSNETVVEEEPATNPDDVELEALRVVVEAFLPLNADQRERVLAYIMHRFDIAVG